LQDAAILERDAVKPATVNSKECYRVTIRRSKTHTGVNNVVPKEVGDALLEVANGNPKYIFWSGNGEPVTVAKDFSVRRLESNCSSRKVRGTRRMQCRSACSKRFFEGPVIAPSVCPSLTRLPHILNIAP